MIDLTGYKLTFDDEFNQRSISQNGGTTWSDIRSEWRLDAQSDIGFGHSSFVDAGSGYDPFSVAGGALTITAVPDTTAFGYPGSWESGLITTQGKFSQTYGYFEMRADLSEAHGAWDAFWLMPDKQTNPTSNNWQELDVIEHYGADPASSYRWIHTTDPTADANSERQVTTSNPEQASGYHTYGMDWEADKISFYFDGQLMGSKATPSDMHSPMYLLANLATQDGAEGTSMSTKIDYIRAYSADSNAAAVHADTVSAPDGHDPGHYGAATANTTQTGSPATPPPMPADIPPTDANAHAASPSTPAATESGPTQPTSNPTSGGENAQPATPALNDATHGAATEPAPPNTSGGLEATSPSVSVPATTPSLPAPAAAEVVQAAPTPVEVKTPVIDINTETAADASSPALDTQFPSKWANESHGRDGGRTHSDGQSHHGSDSDGANYDWHHAAHHVHHHEWSF